MQIAKKGVAKEDILAKISDYDIFRYYLGNFTLGKTVCSPFGKRDTNPSLLVKVGKGGSIMYKDMRFSEYTGDCFKLVMQLFGLSFVEAINKIAMDFGIIDSSHKYEIIKAAYVPEEKIIKPPTLIQVIERPFTNKDLNYWRPEIFSADDLKKDWIFSIKCAWINDSKVQLEKDELAFAYYFPEIDKWKLLFPEKSKKDKWRTNVPNEYVEGKENLVGCTRGLVTKSRKDRMFLRKFIPSVCNTQNESEIAFTEEFVSFLRYNCKEIYLQFDGDETGKKNAKTLTDKHGFGNLCIPQYLVDEGDTDFYDWGKKDGLEPVRKFLKKKGII